MNVIEKYAKQVQELSLELDLFDPEGDQICPAEGTRRLKEFVQGCKEWFTFVDHIVCEKIICKHWKDEGFEQLQGVLSFETFYKVKSGEAKVSAFQVVYANNGKINYINSFWDLSKFKELMAEHNELKEVFRD